MKNENEKPKFQLRKLSVAKIILISLIGALLINCAYLAVETICVKTGRNMPIQSQVTGGECIEQVGLFWRVTILCPMTSAEEHYTPSPNIESFAILQFLGMIMITAFVLWILLMILSRRIKPALICVGILVACALLVTGGTKLKDAWDDTPEELIRVTVITADLHPGVYNSINYPTNASCLVLPGEGQPYGYLDDQEVTDFISPENVTRGQLKALLKAAKAVAENTDTDQKKDFAYKISIVYKTRAGGRKVTHIIGFDAFPAEWESFIQTLGETCGGNYLREKPEMVRYSKEWFCETFGISEKDMPEGKTVDDFINQHKISMQKICGMNPYSWNYECFDPQKLLK